MSSFLLDPIGFRLDGRPFYGFSGAEGDDGGGDDDKDSDGGNDEDDKPDTETDPVKRLESTLAKVRQERREVQDELRSYKSVVRGAGLAGPDALKDVLTKTTKDSPVDVEKIREAARNEARLDANREVALAKVEAAAKGRFADPNDAVDFVRKSVDDLLGRDGKPDSKLIERELDDLLAAKPHWGVGKQQDMSFDGGARSSAGGEKSMDEFLRSTSRRKRGQ